MLSLQEMSDRMEIQDLMAMYSAAVDGHRWELFDQVFVPDAELDYTDVADFETNDVRTFRDWLEAALPTDRNYFHLCATTHVSLDGDTAEAVTLCLNPMPTSDRVLLFGHWYRDHLVRTPEGWRIAKRRLELCFHAPLAPYPGVSPWTRPLRRGLD